MKLFCECDNSKGKENYKDNRESFSNQFLVDGREDEAKYFGGFGHPPAFVGGGGYVRLCPESCRRDRGNYFFQEESFGHSF